MIPTSWLYRILGLATAVAALLWLVQSRDHWRDRARANEQLYLEAQAAHAATVANYRAAAEQARLEDAANLARVKASQAAINERSANDFESRIASARAVAQRLRDQAAGAPADPRVGGAAPVPAFSLAAGGTAQAAGEDGLPSEEHRPRAEIAPLGSNDALIATEQAIQLDELIKWVRAQARVDADSK